MTEKERMLAGALYRSNDPELKKIRFHIQKRLKRFNKLLLVDKRKRSFIISKIFSKTGVACSVYPPFHCDYGCNIEVGNYFFANINCTILDVAPVLIGDYVMLGPGVMILTACHPISPMLRSQGCGFGRSVCIGDNVWIGANAIINPGVEIGNCSVIGAGSVVTKDIPPYVVAAGNPCRVIRSITREKRM